MFFWTGFATAIAAPVASASPEKQVALFYQWYLGYKDPSTLPIERPEISDFVAAHTVKHLRDDLKRGTLPDDADYFLKSQDTGDDWDRHIRVQRATLRHGIAIVPVTIGTHDMKTRIVVFLRREHDRWLIIRVTSRDTGA